MDGMTTNNAAEIQFGLRQLGRGVWTMLAVRVFLVLSRQFEQHPQRGICEVDKIGLCDPSLPIEPMHSQLWVGVSQGKQM